MMMGRKRKKKINDRFFMEIKDMPAQKHKDMLGVIIKCKSKFKVAQELKRKHYKEYEFYKKQEHKAFDELLKAIPKNSFN
jgi:hypothetical protein